MAAKRSPWDAFSDPVAAGHEDEIHAQRVQVAPAGSPARAAPARAPAAGAAANDQYAAFSEANPAALVGGETEGGFADELPPQPVERLPPEVERQVTHILRTGTAQQARDYIRAHVPGWYEPDARYDGKPAHVDNYDIVIAERDRGGRVRDGHHYAIPRPETDATNAFARGAGDFPTLGFLDELGAVADTLGGTDKRNNIWNSDLSFRDLLNQNIDMNRGIIHSDEEQHPIARAAGQIAGSLALPAGMEGVALNAGKLALRNGATMAEARAAAAAAVRNRLMAVGGGVSAGHGFGSGEDGLRSRVTGAFTEGAHRHGDGGSVRKDRGKGRRKPARRGCARSGGHGGRCGRPGL
jgi:hypothetical protein